MSNVAQTLVIVAFATLCGCESVRGLMFGHGAEYRDEYEQHKAAVLAATDAESEAKALRALGVWFENRLYGYYLVAPSQPERTQGVDLNALAVDEPVEMLLYMDSDFEPRSGGFSFVPKNKMNLLHLEGQRGASRHHTTN